MESLPEGTEVKTNQAAPADVCAVVLARKDFPTETLVSSFPAKVRVHNKRVVQSIACPDGSVQRGTLRVARWATADLPPSFPAGALPQFEMREDVFGYEPVHESQETHWYVNFADRHLFGAYSGQLFAQDEMQVAEHPALGSLVECLRATGPDAHLLQAFTRGPGDTPTPYTIMGVERRVRVRTDVNAAAGRPHGLYGNVFAYAPEDAVRKAAEAIDPPTITNLIAMEAPRGGYGVYRKDTVEDAFRTACAGFRAAVLETQRHASGTRVVVHTGNWGTGAYGGNKVLMALLQLAAAHLVGIDRLVFHTFEPQYSKAYREAERLLRQLLETGAKSGRPVSVAGFLAEVVDMGFGWGFSDGN